jgi:hypothetical protein
MIEEEGSGGLEMRDTLFKSPHFRRKFWAEPFSKILVNLE